MEGGLVSGWVGGWEEALKGKERRFEVNLHYTPPLFTLPYYAAVHH